MNIAPNLNSLLPNIRWLCLPSENLGEDWYNKSLEIDSLIHQEGLDLSEESVFLLFTTTPSEVLDGLGQCLVARPVIGPKKKFKSPFELIDWKALPVFKQPLNGETLRDILESASEAREEAIKGAKPYAQDFSLCIRRQLKTELILSIEAIFHE